MQIPSLEEVAAVVGDRYVVERLYGHGGMGAVYLGRNRALESPVAIKVLPLSERTDDEALVRFRREATLAANLSHPHIVPVFEFDARESIAYLVMPFIEGETLADHLAGGRRMAYAEVRALLVQLGSALAFAHGRGVVHRDIKPSNILRERDAGRWLLTDFGIARAIAADRTQVTQSGVIVGTPAYMAPEQAAASPQVDGRSDLFSLAAVAVEALTGERADPLEDGRDAERALRRRRPELRAATVRALVAPLRMDRADRPAGVQDWLRLLEAGGRWWTGWRLTAAMAALVAIASVAAWRVWGRSEPVAAATPVVGVLPFAVRGDAVEGTDLRHVLPRAMEDQLQWVPAHRVLSSSGIEQALVDRFGSGELAGDSAIPFVARRFGATQVVAGSAEVTGRRVRLQIRVETPGADAPARLAEAVSPVDSLANAVEQLVLEAFAQQVARERTGWSAALPRGLEAVNAFFQGDAAFRAGDYATAIRRFDDVVARDSAFAPAYFKRMLATVFHSQPTRATKAVRGALEASRRYRDRLDPATRELLRGYEILVYDGDVQRALDTGADIVARYPSSVDAWFILGYVQFSLGPLLGLPPGSDRHAFQQAHALDPQFAAPVAQLARVALIQDNEAVAREYIREYLRIDSVSVWSQVARMADSALFMGPAAAARVRLSFATRPAAVLETLILGAGELSFERHERRIAIDASATLWDRAATPTDLEVAFKLRLAAHLGTGRVASADTLMREARRRGVERDQLDRWLVLTAVTGTAQLGDAADVGGAAARLFDARLRDVTAAWLAARWYGERDAGRAAESRRALAELVRASRDTIPLHTSLLADLTAHQHLAQGDTSGAVETWIEATRRYSVDEVTFGLVGSLWPLRLARARVAAARADHDGVLAATATFAHMAGYLDQIAWRAVLPLRAEALLATGDGVGARETYQQLANALWQANGSAVALRDSVERRVAELGG